MWYLLLDLSALMNCFTLCPTKKMFYVLERERIHRQTTTSQKKGTLICFWITTLFAGTGLVYEELQFGFSTEVLNLLSVEFSGSPHSPSRGYLRTSYKLKRVCVSPNGACLTFRLLHWDHNIQCLTAVLMNIRVAFAITTD